MILFHFFNWVELNSFKLFLLQNYIMISLGKYLTSITKNIFRIWQCAVRHEIKKPSTISLGKLQFSNQWVPHIQEELMQYSQLFRKSKCSLLDFTFQLGWFAYWIWPERWITRNKLAITNISWLTIWLHFNFPAFRLIVM